MHKGTKLSDKDKLALISNLGTMLASGIPILEAVDSLLEEVTGNTREVLLSLKEDLNQGKKIADSFSNFPEVFDPVTVNLIRAAEEAGTLDTVLKDLAVSLKVDLEFVEKVKTALTYPLVVMVVFFGIMIVILVFVIPRISQVFSRLRINLPLPTRILIFVSNVLLSNVILILFLTVLIVVFAVFLYRTKRKVFIKLIFSLPFLTNLSREIDLTRFSRSMALLLNSGIPIVEALDLSKNVITNSKISAAVKRSQDYVASGKKLSQGLRGKKGIIPGIMLRIIESGERSGTLEKSMLEISEYLDDQVSNTLKRLTTLLEPLLLVVIGLVVGGMMLAIIAPIYGLIGQIQGR